MSVIVVTRPLAVITTEQAKKHLRVDYDDDDDYIGGLIKVAQQHIDGPAGWLGRAVGVQTLELTLDGADFHQACCLDLKFPPFIDVQGFYYLDPSGVEQTLPVSALMVTRHRGRGRVAPAWGTTWPPVQPRPEAVRIQYRAGYQTPTEDAYPIIQAMLLMVGHWFDARTAVTSAKMEVMPMAVDPLLSPFIVR